MGEGRHIVQQIVNDPDLQSRYSKLSSLLPPSTDEFFKLDQHATRAIEVVEISPKFNNWILAEGALPEISEMCAD